MCLTALGSNVEMMVAVDRVGFVIPISSLEVTVELPSGDIISFIGTHLEHQKESADRIGQAKKINEVFLLNEHPTILAGDLNDTPESEPIKILKEHWTDASTTNAALTFPSDEPVKRIDYIFYRPRDRWSVVRTEVICDSVASDHCATAIVSDTSATGRTNMTASARSDRFIRMSRFSGACTRELSVWAAI